MTYLCHLSKMLFSYRFKFMSPIKYLYTDHPRVTLIPIAKTPLGILGYRVTKESTKAYPAFMFNSYQDFRVVGESHLRFQRMLRELEVSSEAKEIIKELK